MSDQQNQQDHATKFAGQQQTSKGKVCVLYCTECGALYSLAKFDETRQYNCSKCQGSLALKKDATVQMNQNAEATQIAAGAGGVAGDPLIGAAIGDYQVTRKIGEGGMGKIYLATQRTLNRQVAIKVLAQNLAQNDEFRPRFEVEARAAAKISHPNIVQVISYGEAQGFPYFVMEFVEGETTKDLVKRGGPVVGDQLHSIMRQSLTGLARAHELGIIHRDIKPDNIMLSSEGTVKIADFGLAKMTDEDMGMTKTGTVFGTPYYMSPEQAEGKKVDPRSDVYSMGASFYFMLAGRVPFEGESFVEIMRQVTNDPVKPPNLVNPKASARLSTFCLRMMAKNPNMRFADASEALRALEKIIELEERGVGGHQVQVTDRQVATAESQNSTFMFLGMIVGALFWLILFFALGAFHPQNKAFKDYMEVQDYYLQNPNEAREALDKLNRFDASENGPRMAEASGQLRTLINANLKERLYKLRENVLPLLDDGEYSDAFHVFTEADDVFVGTDLEVEYVEDRLLLEEKANL